MANNLFVVFATLAFFFLLTNASIYRNVIEFDEDEATNSRSIVPPGTCPKEFQQAQRLEACQQWMEKQAIHAGDGAADADELDLEDDEENPLGPQERPPLLQKCCNQLHKEVPECICKTLRRAAEMVRSQQEIRERSQLQRVFQTAMHLPNVCNIPNVGPCTFEATPSY